MSENKSRAGAGPAGKSADTPRRRDPSQARARETVDTVVNAAMRLFSDRGFDGVTLRDVAAAARKPLGAISYHFSSKEDLWREAAKRLHASIEQHFLQRMAGLEGVDIESRARLFVTEYIRYIAQRPDLFRFMMQITLTDNDKLKWYVRTFTVPFRRHFAAEFAEIRRQHGITRQRDFAALLYTLIGACVFIYAVAPEVRLAANFDPTERPAVERHIELVVRLFLPRSHDRVAQLQAPL